jgi:P-type E1-E2 ATPase
VVAGVTSGNDYSKEKQFRKLNEISEEKDIRAIRAGVQCQVPVSDIQVGDLVLLEVGDKICADGLVVSSDGKQFKGLYTDAF